MCVQSEIRGKEICYLPADRLIKSVFYKRCTDMKYNTSFVLLQKKSIVS